MAQRPAVAFAALLILALCVVSAAALGINCRGSALCSGRGQAMVRLRDSINRDIDPNRQYNNGEQIACTDNNICAFVQSFAGHQVTGRKLASVIPYLVDHACRTCGSVPLDFPFSNDVNNGQLTVNYVTGACNRKPGSDVCV